MHEVRAEVRRAVTTPRLYDEIFLVEFKFFFFSGEVVKTRGSGLDVQTRIICSRKVRKIEP